LEALVDVSQGDLRQAITLLQTAKNFKAISGPEAIYEMTGVIIDSHRLFQNQS
jgi:DNA polymerase III delta prime subunit